MPERDSNSEMGWAAEWIEERREALRQSKNQTGAAAASEVGASIPQDAGPARAGDAAAPKNFQEMLDSWRDAWSAAAGAQQASAAQFAEAFAKVPGVGPLREHAETWRAVAAAQADYRKLEQEVSTVMLSVQRDALDLVQQQVRARNAAAQPVQDLRELHRMWVECGERVFAKVAHSEEYCKLQGELRNALTRLRAQQQKVIEHTLKQFDLPTRSELNTVHRQLRDQKAQLREQKEMLARFLDRMKPVKRTGTARKTSRAGSKSRSKRAAR